MNFRLIIFLLLTINFQFAAQNVDYKDSSNTATIKIDTNKSDIPYFKKNTFEPKIFYNSELKKWEIFIPGYRLNNKQIYSGTLSLNNLASGNIFTYSKDEMKTYHESLRLLLDIQYGERMKYDLGEIGKILGISKNIFAIILAILSL
ncbi:hypothetical protein LJE86_04020 [bacterium BMS3Abin03]|nr:hypothetical protein [bacterium BMS3Abin03]MCG6960582.1 hypothetical protein [bacterium BMS3Abin03]